MVPILIKFKLFTHTHIYLAKHCIIWEITWYRSRGLNNQKLKLSINITILEKGILVQSTLLLLIVNWKNIVVQSCLKTNLFHFQWRLISKSSSLICLRREIGQKNFLSRLFNISNGPLQTLVNFKGLQLYQCKRVWQIWNNNLFYVQKPKNV